MAGLMIADETQRLPAEAPPAAAAAQRRGTDLGRAGRLGLWALVLGFGGFVLWAALAPLDEGVPAPAQVVLDTKRKVVQHLTGGIVQQVLVGEGQEVREGQLLLKLDPAVARANYESVRQNYLSLLATQARLQAERGGQATIDWPEALRTASAADPQVQRQMLNQEQLFASRRALLQSDLQGIENTIRGQQALLQSYADIQANRKSQQALLGEQLGNLRGLVQEGYAPRNQQLDLERSLADVNAALADVQGNTLQGRSTIAELRQRVLSRRHDYRRDVESQLAEVNRQVRAEEEKFLAVGNDLERTEVKSPASGQVVGLAVQTVGAVVAPGQKLMDVVPAGAPVLLEARVPPMVIDRVHAGLPVDVRFSAFANTPQLVVQGQVESISGDLLSDAPNGMELPGSGHYLARVAITPEGMHRLNGRLLHPGMPAEVVIKGGERSMLAYLLHPLVKRVAASMTED